MNYQKIYEQLFIATQEAGNIALMMQKNIINVGKEVEWVDGEDDHHKAMREAKTKADDLVQDILLSALIPQYQDILTLDVEEESEKIHCFTRHDYEYTLVIDPIDGTLDYLQQKNTYSICSAILHKHDVKVALVYFPARNEAFSYCEGLGTMHYEEMKKATWNQASLLNGIPKQEIPNIIYKNSRLSKDIVHQLETRGFIVIDDQQDHLGCPNAILECLYGRGLAYFSDTRNIRDILLGAILCKMPFGQAYTYKGEKAKWHSHGRQKEIVFSIYEKKDIFL